MAVRDTQYFIHDNVGKFKNHIENTKKKKTIETKSRIWRVWMFIISVLYSRKFTTHLTYTVFEYIQSIR